MELWCWLKSLRDDAKAAERAETGVDAVDRTRLSDHLLDELSGFGGCAAGIGIQFAGRVLRSQLPGLGDGKFVSVQRDHRSKNGALFYNKLYEQARSPV